MLTCPGRTLVRLCGVTRTADQVTVNSAGTELTFQTPACRPGARTLTVITPDGTATATFRYLDPSLASTGSDGSAALGAMSLMFLAGGLLVVRLRRRFTTPTSA